jgi:pSer/pThr/pTyr-binding forkhead associated (FHA) protein
MVNDTDKSRAILTVVDGRSQGASLELKETRAYTIGRSNEADLQLRDLPVSRLHCKVEYDGAHFWLIDADSVNGTFVNGQKVQRYMLYDGDTIRLGKTHITFRLLEQPNETASSVPLAPEQQ